MIAITDLVTIILSIFFLALGASRGFINSLMGPFSVLMTTILSVLCYQSTKNVVLSLLIGLFGPFLMLFFLKLILKAWEIATNTESKPNLLSRLGGALLTLAWGEVFVLFTLILLVILPPWGKPLIVVHNDVRHSVSYTLAQSLENVLFGIPQQDLAIPANSPSNTDAASLANDPRFQVILQDPEIQKEIDAHDFASLFKNPKIMALTQQIMSDPATMKKIFALYNSSQAQLQTSKK